MTQGNQLEAWLAAEAEVLAKLEAGPGPGLARPDQIEGKTGIEVMQMMLAGEIPYAAIAKTLDFTIIEVRPGVAIFQGTPLPQHLNPLGTIHGGWAATMLDSALGCSVHTMMPAGRGYTTAELSVNYVRGLTPKIARVRAEGKVIHCGRQLATAEARLVGADGTLYAHATTTCLVFELPKR
ncbi:MAG: PaaI family thioesterase [Comamonadaceae bacterium]|nr:MAG: PaaI family thioesterase [Comamonadaceae bacterium]